LTHPEPLQPGDQVALVATARKVTEADLAAAEETLSQWGYSPVRAPDLLASSHQFAGTDAQRTASLQATLDHPEIKAILCARGGYGTVRIVDRLNWEGFRKHPKWITGYSDVTVLHNSINNLGYLSIHGPLAVSFKGANASSLEALRQMWQGQRPPLHFSSNHCNGAAEGVLLGGNLSMLYSQLGSHSALKGRDFILFLEDLDEYLYHVDRMMMNLKRNGLLDRAAGFLVGSLSDMNDNAIPFGESATEILLRHLKASGKPYFFDAPCGHLSSPYPLLLGAPVRLSANEDKVTLQYL